MSIHPLIPLVAMALAAPASATVPAPATQPTRMVSYKRVGDVELRLHIFNPPGHQASDRRPAIVLFHGGSWKNGVPTLLYPQAHYLSSRGMVAIAAEYRQTAQEGVTPPDCVTDAKSAMRYVRKHAAELGIDPTRIAAGGGSAGGHLAVAVAVLKAFDDPGDDLSISTRPVAVVLFNPVLDNRPGQFGYQAQLKDWRDFSPMEHISPDMPPAIFMVGDSDKLIPVETAKHFEKIMHAAGVRCDLHIYPQQQHAFFNKEPYLTKTINEADAFLTSLGLLEKPAK